MTRPRIPQHKLARFLGTISPVLACPAFTATRVAFHTGATPTNTTDVEAAYRAARSAR